MTLLSRKFFLLGTTAMILFAASPALAGPAGPANEDNAAAAIETASDGDELSEENVVPQTDMPVTAEQSLETEDDEAGEEASSDTEDERTNKDDLPESDNAIEVTPPEEGLEETAADAEPPAPAQPEEAPAVPAKESKRWWGRPY